MNAAPTNESDAHVVTLKSFFSDLIPGYLEQRIEDLALFEEFLAVEAFEEIRKLGHKLKGSGATYGFVVLSQHGDVLQTAGRTQDREMIRQTLTQMRTYLQNVKVIYQD